MAIDRSVLSGTREANLRSVDGRRRSSGTAHRRRLRSTTTGAATENRIVGFRNRLFQHLARFAPGATSVRVWLHRRRGVHLGKDVFIGTDVLIETAHPRRVFIGNNVVIGMRSVLVAHTDAQDAHRNAATGRRSCLVVEDDVFVGPGALILPNVRVGRGAVIAAGSVVTRSVAPCTMVQGNPARPVARCASPLKSGMSIWKFFRGLSRIEE